MSRYSKQDLMSHAPKHPTFVGIDSDGCVFPTMEIKQKQCFHGEIVRQWKLEKIEKYVREAAEFINLYSKYRGVNRFPALLRNMDLIRDRPEVVASGVAVPKFESLRRYVESGLPMSNATLKSEAERTGDPELKAVLEWSLQVNRNVEQTVKKVPPFRWALRCLERMFKSSDLIVVSQTPEEALVREWQENGMDHLIPIIAGQELGTKAEHLAMATKGRYPGDRILMIGDAPGDEKAAKAVNAHFFPINPGHEEESWQLLCEEAYDKFLAGAYGNSYEAALVAKFHALLPETPPWVRK